MAQHLKPRIVTDQLALNFDGNGGGKGANKYVSPNSLSARCIMWLDAADESTIIHSSNAVTDWLDKSSAVEFGGASNATDDDTSSHRPTYNKKSLNGLGGISFDGSANALRAVFNSNNYVADNAPNDIIIVFRALSTNAAQNGGTEADNTLYIFDGDTDRRVLKHEQSSSGMNWFAGAGANTGSDGDLNGLDPHIVTVRFADSGYLWNNGLRVGGASDVLTSSIGLQDIYIGADTVHARNSNIEVFEMMVFQSTLTDEERHQMEFYLSHKWDIPLQLSTGGGLSRGARDSTENAKPSTSSIDYLFPAVNSNRGIIIGNEAGRSITYTTNSKISDLNANGGYTVEWAAAMICCQADSDRTGGTNYALIANETYQSNGFVLRYDGSSYGRPYWRENHSGGTSTHDDLKVDEADRTVAGEWAHWHGVYDGGSKFTWYKNGVEIKSVSDFEGITATSNNMTFLAQSSQCFVGEVAFLRLYQKALTHGEIMQNYNATKSRINAIPKIPAPKNAVLYVDASGPCRTRTYTSATFFDLGPNEIDGTVQGASQASTNVSNLPKHYDFDGTNDYIDFGNTSHTQFEHDDNFSLLIWFKPDAISGFKHLIGKTYGNYRLTQNNATLSFRLDENNLIAASGNVLSAGTWYCAIATYDASTKIALVYLDGVQVASQQNTNVDWDNTSANFQLGNSSGESYYFDGKIATGMVYDITLSQDQVTQAYNYFKNRFGKA
jgi:hypothetical protein